jgi:urease accessory protein
MKRAGRPLRAARFDRDFANRIEVMALNAIISLCEAIAGTIRMYVDTSCSDTSGRLQRAEGRARITFGMRDGACRLHTLFQEGCAKIRLPTPLPGQCPEAIVINTAGGLTGGDRFRVEAELGVHTTAVLTTQACERIYRSIGNDAVVENNLHVAPGARLAWLPQESILFDGGRLARRLDVNLEGDAEFVAVEAVLLGRTAMGERVHAGSLRDRWRVRRDSKLIFADDLRLNGNIAEITASAATLGGRSAFATVFYAGNEFERLLAPVRDALGEDGGASAWNGKLVVRLTAISGLLLRRRLEPILTLLLGGQPLPKAWQL